MKKSVYIFVTILAVIAVVSLQGMWFSKTYDLLEDKLCANLNAAFESAIQEQMRIAGRRHKGAIPNGTIIEMDSTKTRTKKVSFNNALALVGIYEAHHQYKVPLDTLVLDSLFRQELINLQLNELDFRINPVKIDTTRFKYVEDFTEDPTLIKSQSKIQTIIIPTRTNLSQGMQATITNPYRSILMEMKMFLIGTILILLVAIYCIAQQIKIIIRQNKIAQLREDFSYAMIHDMKTPLSSILMGTRVLRSGKLDDKPEKKVKYFDIMEDEEEHLLALVNKVLTLSKLEESKLLLDKRETLLQPIIDDLIEKFTAKAEKPVTFRTQLNAKTVCADEEYLKEAISNLIDNAIKYSKESVKIDITSALVSDKYTQIKVRDNGMGIPFREQAKIFEKYERASAVNRNRKGGASGFGLGLNYVFHVIKAHEGNVELESIEGEYSEFSINIPQQIKKAV